VIETRESRSQLDSILELQRGCERSEKIKIRSEKKKKYQHEVETVEVKRHSK
jgi:hypothetical protein